MPSTRSTQPRLVTEPTMKPMLAPPRHSSTPTCTRFNGACALAPVKDATSRVTATPARRDERRMKKSPADECDAKKGSECAPRPGRNSSMAQLWRPCHTRGAPILRQTKGPPGRAFRLTIWAASTARQRRDFTREFLSQSLPPPLFGVDTGLREENASKQKIWSPVPIRSERKRL